MPVYPEFVTAPFGAAAEYFFSPPTPNELNAQGWIDRAVLDQMDQVLCEIIRKQMQDYAPEPETLGRGTNPMNRWRTVSSLQKAVRFADTAAARFAASAGYDMDPGYVLRRLGVIAMEDVGFGNLFAVCAVQAAAHSVLWRRKLDERLVFCWLAEQLAGGAKDRSACELLVMADFDRTLNREAAAECSTADLEQVARDQAAPTLHRIICAWLMVGTKRFPGETMPKTERSTGPFFRMLVDMGCPRALLYAAHRSAFRLSDGLFPGLPLMHDWMTATTAPALIKPVMPLIEKVGVLLGPAYDMHTREGRVAMRRFEKECPAVGAFRQHLDPEVPVPDQNKLMGFGLFCAEGGVLQRRVSYGNGLSEEARTIAHLAELNFPGLPPEHHAPFLQTLQANLAQLNEIRRECVWSSQNKG